MSEQHKFGKEGEQLARSYLEKKDYQIREMNWRYRHTEVDIIAETEQFVVFVEVKTRQNAVYGYPEEAVNQSKQDALQRAAEAYIEEYDIDKEVRFDIVAIVWRQSGSPELRHFEDAFFPYA